MCKLFLPYCGLPLKVFGDECQEGGKESTTQGVRFTALFPHSHLILVGIWGEKVTAHMKSA